MTISTDTIETTGGHAIVELMGHKVVAGYVSKDEMFGKPILRVDVPATEAFPAYTQHYGVEAIYCITWVSEEVARRTAEHIKVNPISVYVPDLSEMQTAKESLARAREIVQKQSDEIRRLKGLPAPAGEVADEDDDA